MWRNLESSGSGNFLFMTKQLHGNGLQQSNNTVYLPTCGANVTLKINFVGESDGR
jgi:hypothetical protein